MSDLITEIDGKIAYGIFNRPEARNALSDDMRTELIEFLRQADLNPEVRCVVFRGAGDHFMAGGDVKTHARFARENTAAQRSEIFQERLGNLNSIMTLMHGLRKPIIASVQGAAAGLGMSFVLACDFVVAAHDSFFVSAYIKIGTTTDGAGSYFLPRIVGIRKAMEIALLSERIDALEAKQLGLVNRVVPVNELNAETRKLAEQLAAGPTHAIANMKTLINGSLGNTFEMQLENEVKSFADCTMTDDWAEGVTAFAEKRTPTFKGK